MKPIIVDTSIFLYSLSKVKSRSEAVLDCLKGLTEDGHALIISQYTIFEGLRSSWGKKAEEANAALLNYEANLVSSDVLKLAAQLHGLYHDEGIDNVSDGDKIIAATAILLGGLVFTRNHKDFPNPFFTVSRFMPLPVQLHHHSEYLDLALYEPALELISRRIDEKYNQGEK